MEERTDEAEAFSAASAAAAFRDSLGATTGAEGSVRGTRRRGTPKNTLGRGWLIGQEPVGLARRRLTNGITYNATAGHDRGK